MLKSQFLEVTINHEDLYEMLSRCTLDLTAALTPSTMPTSPGYLSWRSQYMFIRSSVDLKPLAVTSYFCFSF